MVRDWKEPFFINFSLCKEQNLKLFHKYIPYLDVYNYCGILILVIDTNIVQVMSQVLRAYTVQYLFFGSNSSTHITSQAALQLLAFL